MHTGCGGQEFDASLYDFTINQNARQNDIVYSVTCTHSGDVRYNITSFFPNGLKFLTIDVETGDLSLVVNSIDVSVEEHQLTLHCYDPSSDPSVSSDFSFLYVNRIDENEFKPVFHHSSTIELSISESQDVTPEYVVVDLNATDNDVGTFGDIEYGTQGPLPDPFSLNPSTGVISLISSLDYDRSENQYTIIATASNSPIPETGVVRSAEVLVSIMVLDVNDEVPIFSEPDGYRISVHETAPVLGYPRPDPGFYSVECNDLDNPPSDITYAISSESDPGPFTLDKQTGELNVTEDLDYETRTSFSFEVACYDNGVSVNLSSSVLFDITITSVNEFAPTINDSGPDAISVPEDVPVGTILFSSIEGVGMFGTYILEDLDDGPDGELVYFLGSDQGDNQYFEVEMQTGNMKIILPLDIDTLSLPFLSLNVRVRACDTTPPRPTCPNILKQLLVQSVNEFAPRFLQNDFDVTYSELTGVGTTIVVAPCQDDDLTFGPSYTIQWENPSQEVQDTFKVNSASGAITTTLILDYETYRSYTIVLVCTDGEYEDTAIVKIAIEPENDNEPQFESSNYTFSVSRTTPDNRYAVGQVFAIDNDIDKGEELNYTLVDRNGNFDVTNNGVIELFNSVLNHTEDNITLSIEVSDGQYTNIAQVVIQLTPGNLHQPQIAETAVFFDVSELSNPGTRITTLECTDMDTGVNGETIVSIADGNTDNAFEIDPSSRELVVASTLVLPQDSLDVRYSLSIHCEDGGIPVYSDDVTIFVTVFQDSTPPEIQNETIVVFVSEDASLNDVVTTIVSSDLEMGEIEFSFYSESVPNIFEIGESSGIVIVAAALDREVVSQYELVVVASEVREPGQIGPKRSDNATLIIYVRDINDNKPECQSTGTVVIEETLSPGSTILQLNCSDLDFGSNAEISYSLTNNFGIFAINDQGEITLVNPLNQTELNTLTFSVIVTDNGFLQLQDSYQVTIFISYTNRHRPTFVNLPTILELGESQPIQNEIFMVQATDPDRGSFGHISYNIVNGGANTLEPFQIFENTGVVTLTQKLDYYQQERYLLNISASDSDYTVTEILTIQVLDENEYRPRCDTTFITTSILEGLLPPQTLSTKLTCSDDDRGPNGNLSFSIQSDVGSNVFSINEDGSIVTREMIDFELVGRYELPVEISDSGNPPFSINATVVVIVQPVNEFPPVFTQTTYTATIQEGTNVGTSVLDVVAVDQDNPAHQDGQITYSILGTEERPFSISNTGVLQIAGNIDREEESFYSLTIQASDQGQPVRVDTATVEVSILDLDDSSPEFTRQVYYGTLNGTTGGGTPVINVSCTDDDLGINAEVVYSLTGSEGSGFEHFEVLNSGLIQISEDLPVSQTYSFRAVCTGRGPSNFSDDTIVTIQVLVESNITFIPSSYSANISEATEPGYVILYVNASSSTDVALTYKLLSTGSPFSLDPNTGELQLFANIDYETTTSFAIQVQASDNGNPPNIGETLVQILVQNENDNSPMISTNPTTTFISEGPMALPMTAGTYQCTDMDAGTFGQVDFRIASGDLDGMFTISQSGVLQLISELDYEAVQSYSLELVCVDGGMPSRHDSITVPVTVSPINDNAPEFGSETLEVSVTENLMVSSQIGTIFEASDMDLAPHNILHYSIISGNENPRAFSISSTTGQLTLIQALDYEVKQTFSLVVLAEDSGGQADPDFTVLNDTITVQIAVTDYNDNNPVFSKPVYSGSIEERASIDDQVLFDGTISCTDQDSGTNGEISLHIIEESPFAIQNSGIVTIKDTLDFEVVVLYQLTVQCRDGGTPQLTSDATVIIFILDSNEFGPEFNQTPYNIEVNESTRLGTVVGGVFAEDRDAGEAGTVTYSFTNVTTSVFALDSATGTITLLSSLDYETQTRLFVLGVIANDTAGLEASTTIIIQVLNDDDNRPSFALGNYLTSVPENAVTGTMVLQVSCTDADDQADNVPVGYQLNTAAAPFSIDASGGITVSGEIDLEVNPRHTLALTCSDSAGNTAVATVTVDLEPFNDFTPVFTGELPYATELAENPGIGLSVFQVTATDDDTVKYSDITFSFVSGNEEDRFEIDPSSGVVTVSMSIDREEEDLYVLVVQAQNVIPSSDTSGSQPLFSTTMLAITITDLNDNDPEISPSEVSRFIPEPESSGIIVENFTCSDQDLGLNSLTNFSITSENSNVFEISEDGTLSTTDTITSNVVVQVICSDNGTPQRMSTAVVAIETMSMNDHHPIILADEIVFTDVPDDTPVGTDVICFSATDDDGTDTPDGVVSYTVDAIFTGTDVSRFSIREDTGCVFVSIVLNADFGTFYRYTVTATDGGDPPLSDSISLYLIVTDVLEDPPVFVGDPYVRVVSEGIESGTLIANTLCTDQDENDNITYSITSGNDGTFSIDESIGTVIIATSQRLDYETTTSYTLVVECTDTDLLTDTAMIFVTVTPVNEHTPIFQFLQVSVQEHSIVGTLVTQLMWMDNDAGSDGEVSFNITSGNTNNVFLLTNDGRILVSGLLDRETWDFYSLEIQITDQSESLDERRSSTNYVNITLSDINDHAPEFDKDPYIFVPLQGSELPGYYLGTLTCRDMDIGTNGQITYQLAPGNSELFSIDATTGNLSLSSDLDNRQFDNITFFAECVDAGSRQMTGSTRVLVSVVESNRHPPVFANESYYLTVPENTPILIVTLLTVEATDEDSGVNGQVRYSLVDDHNNQFYIDATTGEISLLKPLDFESVTEYRLMVEATDGTQDSMIQRRATANVTVVVSGVNEYEPFCSNGVFTAVINGSTDGAVLAIDCTDDDSGNDGDLSFIITSGGDPGFSITSTGTIVIPTPILPDMDIEQYNLEITVSDSGVPIRSTVVQAVLVYSFTNVNFPSFGETIYFLEISEDEEVGRIIETFTATDPDPGLQGQITYSLSGTDNFRIDATNGGLFAARPLDYETLPTEEFTLSAIDGDLSSPMSGTTRVNITLINVNDNLPQCTNMFYTNEISSNSEVDETILTLECTDPDGDALTFQLLTPSNAFAIEETTGRVHVAGTLTPTSTATLKIAVSDIGGMTTEVSVNIQVKLANEEPPVLSQNSYTFEILEDTPLLSVFGSVIATDSDSNEIDLTYSIVDADNVAHFYVSPRGDVQLVLPLDYEVEQQYSFSVMVSDSGSFDGSNQLHDTALVTVNVVNVNDNFPRLSDGGVYGITIEQGSLNVGSAVLSFTCTDKDLVPVEAPTVSDAHFASTPFQLLSVEEDHVIQVMEELTTSGEYYINITCSDAEGLSTDGQIIIFVPEVNAPEYTEAMYQWVLSEHAQSGSQFTEIEATSSGGGDITYAIADTQGTFYIDRNTGVVTLVSSLDYETQQSHALVITATDSGNSQSSVLLIVRVQDENDQVPLTDLSTVLQVERNAPAGHPLGTVQCSDDDTNPNGTMYDFAFTPTSSLFSIDKYGVVRLEVTLDSTPVHVLPVSCYDISAPQMSSMGLVTIQVLFTNEYVPEFDFENYTFSIREDAAPLSIVGTVSAIDEDSGSFGELMYAIDSQDSPESFYIESATGLIRTLSHLDREARNSHTITVTAVDGGSLASEERRTGNTVVTILVQDANDNPPTLDQPSYAGAIMTNHTILTPVVSVECTDSDLAENSQIGYSLEPSSDDFVVRADGVIILTREQSDEAVYHFNVVCTDRGTPTLSSSSLVTVAVDLLQTNAPTFIMDSYTAVIPEDTTVSTIIVQVETTTTEVVYRIAGGNDGDVFHINPTSGEIAVLSPLDASQQQLYTLTVEATTVGRSSLSSFVTVVVTVTDINDNSPQFSSSLYQNRVSEGATPLTPLVQVNCIDADPASEISYEITGGLTDPVLNITQEGLVIVATELDYESTIVYTLEITCSDGGDSPLTAETTVRIEVLPVNEFLPEFLEPIYQFTAVENAFGTLLGRVEAEDGDAGSQGEVTYHLQDPGNFSAVFVEPSTGDLLVASDLDYEEQPFWNFTVIARDGAGAESYVFVAITVVNLNDVHPIVSPVTAITVVPHDTPVGLPIQQYVCTDGDGSPTTLTIFQGNNQGYFDLNEFSQLVWTGTAIGLASDAIVSLTIECYDSAATEQRVLAYIAVTIRVIDSAPPVFTQQLYQRVVGEDIEVNSTVLTVSATAENDVEYDLFNLPAGFPFSIAMTSGDISVNAPLNRELTLLYVFTVRASDTITGALGIALVELTIGDSNDNKPDILPLEQSITLPEDLAWPTQLISFACTDDDTGPNSETLFQITSSDITESVLGIFQITSAGIVELVGPLDFESSTTYNLNVTCFDSGDPPLSDSTSLTVVVTGVNEYVPEFNFEMYQFSVEEGVVAGALVGSVSATDRDGGSDGQLRYEIVSGSGLGFFSVNSQGEIRTRTQSLNATEYPNLEVILRAEDEGQLSKDVVVTIDLEDINEPPRFSSNSYFAATASDEPAGTDILDFVCYDTDVNNNSLLNVEITTNAHNLDISLETESSGNVVVATIVINSPLDAGAYEVVLRCTDSGSPSLNSTASVTIRVEGINQPPQFSHGSFAISVSEDTIPGTSLTRVNATDFESGTDVIYEISGGNGLGTFNIDPTTGNIILVLSLDYETTPDYAVTITAYDNFIFNRQSASIQVFIYVINANDIPPFLSPSGIQVITVSENTEPVSDILYYTCTDPDGAGVTYSLGSPSHPFSITQSGVVQLVGNIDYEDGIMYALIVTCSDLVVQSGEESLHVSSTLIIHVTPVNNYPPEFVSPDTFVISEATQVGAVIATVQATDQDGRGRITYSTSSHTNLFLIDQYLGNITLIQELDYESTQQYTLTVEASDNDNTQGTVTPRTATQVITVQIIDIDDNRNDNAPRFNQSVYRGSVKENQLNGSVVLHVSATDIDLGTNADFIYSLDTNTGFAIDPLSGEIVTIEALDYESAMSHTFLVFATDLGFPRLTGSAAVIVNVLDTNDIPPRFTQSVYTATINDVSQSGHKVVMLNVTDPDTIGSLYYQLNTTDPRITELFGFEQQTGTLILIALTGHDRHTLTYEFSVQVSDGVASDFANVVIYVEFVSLTTVVWEENSEDLSFDVQNFLLEQEFNFSFIADYSITAGNEGHEFVISPHGILSLQQALDREQTPQYTLTIRIGDNHTSENVNLTLTVIVSDQNDNPPVFSSLQYTFNITEVHRSLVPRSRILIPSTDPGWGRV